MTLATTRPLVTGTTRVFGTIAHPADHVRAPTVFNSIFAERGLDHVMVPIDAPPHSLIEILAALRAIPNFRGMAVTIPLKMKIAGLGDTLGLAARLTGAVNAVRFDADGSMHGDNFDGEGFVAGLRQQGHDPAGKDVLMVGAGGRRVPLRWHCAKQGTVGCGSAIVHRKRQARLCLRLRTLANTARPGRRWIMMAPVST